MKHVVCFFLLMGAALGITYLAISNSWAPSTYFFTMMGTGGILGFVTGLVGYEA